MECMDMHIFMQPYTICAQQNGEQSSMKGSYHVCVYAERCCVYTQAEHWYMPVILPHSNMHPVFADALYNLNQYAVASLRY